MSEVFELMLRPAENLYDLGLTVDAEPLLTKEQIEAFYYDGNNRLTEVRNTDVLYRLKDEVTARSPSGTNKLYLCGRVGSGKSTEITRLKTELSEGPKRFITIRFEVTNELDALNFKTFDVLLLIVDLICKRFEETAGLGLAALDKQLVKNVHGWFNEVKVTTAKDRSFEIEGSAGVGWEALRIAFAKIRGSLKYTNTRKTEEIDYAFNKISSLVEAFNAFLNDARAVLQTQMDSDLLIVAEGFDKLNVPPKVSREFFVTYGAVLKQLRCSMILNLPLDLKYSAFGKEIPDFPEVVIRDIPIFNADKSANDQGRTVLEELLAKRMNLELFEVNQLKRLVVASGGSIRSLFRLVNHAASRARERDHERIQLDDTTYAIVQGRVEMQERLGTEYPEGEEKVTWSDKLLRLAEIDNDRRSAEESDRIRESLIRIQALLEYNGVSWFGLHPLAVEVLKRHDRLPSTARGGLLTEDGEES